MDRIRRFGGQEMWGKPALAKLFLQGALLQFAGEEVEEEQKWSVTEKVTPFMARHGYSAAHVHQLLRENEEASSGVFYDPRPGQSIVALRPRAQIISYLLRVAQDSRSPMRAQLASEFIDYSYQATEDSSNRWIPAPDFWVR